MKRAYLLFRTGIPAISLGPGLFPVEKKKIGQRQQGHTRQSDGSVGRRLVERLAKWSKSCEADSSFAWNCALKTLPSVYKEIDGFSPLACAERNQETVSRSSLVGYQASRPSRGSTRSQMTRTRSGTPLGPISERAPSNPLLHVNARPLPCCHEVAQAQAV
ncbi:hypothetical protein BC628DRAFT_1404040 [Trametes gibbosa]|nr:hypothetical protein BC628DRAFT_1404040 [Trametes gibbosa]